MPLRRLPHAESTKRLISEALRGVPRSEETKRKISEALKGRKLAAHVVEGIKAERAARPKKSTETVLEACNKEVVRRRRSAGTKQLEQWKTDMDVAGRLGDLDLLLDIRDSKGWHYKRKLFCPEVSDGVDKDQPTFPIVWTTRNAWKKIKAGEKT